MTSDSAPVTRRQKIEAEIEEKIDQGEAIVQKLKAKMDQAGDEAKEEFSEAVQAAEHRVEQGKAKLKQLAAATDDEFDELWGDVKEGWHKVAHELEHGWDSLSDRVKKFLA